MGIYFRVLLHFTDFSGRTNRQEFWTFLLIQSLIFLPLLGLDLLSGFFNKDVYLGVLSGVFVGLTCLPTWAVTTRRLHDTNRSGWWQVLPLVPVLGTLLLIYFCTDRGTEGDNIYGPHPSRAEATWSRYDNLPPIRARQTG